MDEVETVVAEGWPRARKGYIPTATGPHAWWCERCGALVHKDKADLHDAFHSTHGPLDHRH